MNPQITQIGADKGQNQSADERKHVPAGVSRDERR